MPGSYNQVPARDLIKIGGRVKVLQKKDYESGLITLGLVKKILTSKTLHPRGIKVMLESGEVGRVQALGDDSVIPLPDQTFHYSEDYPDNELPSEDDLR